MTMAMEKDMAMAIEKEEDQAMAMKVVNASTIREILTYPLLTSRLRDSFANLDTFCIPTAWRHAVCEREGESMSASSNTPTLLLMPAWSRSPRCPYLLVKSVTVFPENGSKGLPAVAGTYILSSSETGRLHHQFVECVLALLVDSWR